MNRRKFIRSTGQVGLGLAVASCGVDPEPQQVAAPSLVASKGPVSICTWGFENANQASGNALVNGKSALEAAIEGVSVEEENVKNTTVGKGGAPDREGRVTLDACVMAPDGNAGSVVCVQNITHVASLAKMVMEKTPHVMLAGIGAEEFAYQNGFVKEDLLTKESKEAYNEWLKEKNYSDTVQRIHNHKNISIPV